MTENAVHATYLSQLQYPSAQGYLRQMAIGDFTLENGTVLPQVNIGYETWGTLNEAGDNAILILHALTGDTHVSRGIPTSDMPAPSIRAVESDGWWEGIVGPGRGGRYHQIFCDRPQYLGWMLRLDRSGKHRTRRVSGCRKTLGVTLSSRHYSRLGTSRSRTYRPVGD